MPLVSEREPIGSLALAPVTVVKAAKQAKHAVENFMTIRFVPGLTHFDRGAAILLNQASDRKPGRFKPDKSSRQCRLTSAPPNQ